MKSLIKQIASKALAAALLASVAISPAFSQAFNPAPTNYAYGNYTPIGPRVGGLLGSYAVSMTSGTMAAALAAASDIYAFRYTGTGYAVVRKVSISAATLTGFAAGTAQFNVFPARAFTAAEAGGTAATLTGNNGKLRTSFATTASTIRAASTAALTPGTYTLDTQAWGTSNVATPTTSNVQLLANTDIISPTNFGANYPVALANNEGFVVQATVPATGTWNFVVTVWYDEFSAY